MIGMYEEKKRHHSEAAAWRERLNHDIVHFLNGGQPWVIEKGEKEKHLHRLRYVPSV